MSEKVKTEGIDQLAQKSAFFNREMSRDEIAKYVRADLQIAHVTLSVLLSSRGAKALEALTDAYYEDHLQLLRNQLDKGGE